MLNKNYIGKYPRLMFLNKFYLYGGLDYYFSDIFKMADSMEVTEEKAMKTFNCSKDWPICLFDFTYKNRIPTFFCFKV